MRMQACHGAAQSKSNAAMAWQGGAVRAVRTKASLLLLLWRDFFLVFAALGTWQVYRLQWKLDLIAKVDARVHAAPVAPPAPQDWPNVGAERMNTARGLSGRYLYSKTVAVQASTDLGSGAWLLTPLQPPTAAWCWSTAASCRFRRRWPPSCRRLRGSERSDRPVAHERAGRRFPAQQRRRTEPLVFA
jgi:hypothetical protein